MLLIKNGIDHDLERFIESLVRRMVEKMKQRKQDLVMKRWWSLRKNLKVNDKEYKYIYKFLLSY